MQSLGLSDNTTGRAGTFLLDVKYSDKALPKEIMMSYDNDDFGHLYMKSATDSTVIDLQTYLNEVRKTDAKDVIINIDGVEENLTEAIEGIRRQIGNSIVSIPMDGNLVYIEKPYAYDSDSIEIFNGRVQIKGFSEAADFTLPVKNDNKISWIKASNITGGNHSGNSNIGGSYSNDDDGLMGGVQEIEQLNGKIYLLASKNLMTRYLTRNCNVYLPITTDRYAEINWCLITNSFAPVLTFEDKVKWARTSGKNPIDNGTNVFTFKTWDNGKTWQASVDRYSKTIVTDYNGNSINIDIFSQYFPTIEKLEKEYYNRTQSDDKYLTKDSADDTYVSKDDMIDFASWKDSVSNSNDTTK